MRSSKLLFLAASFTLAACASAPQGSGSSTDTKITADQIMQANVPTAYEAIDRLHRQWFQDPTLPQDTVVVYLSTNEKLGNGGKEDLRQVPAEDVQLIEYLQGSSAVMRFGQEAKGGAIIVTRK